MSLVRDEIEVLPAPLSRLVADAAPSVASVGLAALLAGTGAAVATHDPLGVLRGEKC